MKKLLLLGMLFFFLTGCEKEELTPDTEAGISELDFRTSANKEKMVPLKGEIIEIPDLFYGYLDCGIPAIQEPKHYDDIGGNLTHLGNVAGGYGDLDNCRIEVREGEMYVVADGSGEIMSASGDVLRYDGEMWISFSDPALNGSLFAITGGTGRWENARGHFAGFFEPLEDGTLFFGIDGFVTPPGKNK